jgi:DNA-binding MarR family transcriptional regulator
METLSNCDRSNDGRIVLKGAAVLPPMEPTQPPTVTPSANAKRDRKPNKATGDRFGVLNAFVDCSMRGLSRVELAAWFVLYRDTKRGTACTSQSDIARRTGCTVRAVQKALRRLIDRGLVVLVRRGRLNAGASVYRLEPLASKRRAERDHKTNRGSGCLTNF